MNKLKAGFVSAVIVILGGGFVWSLYRSNIWSYYTAMQILGFYGFIQAGINLYRWISKPEDPNAPKTYEEWATQYEKKGE